MTPRKDQVLASRFRLVRPLGVGGLGEVWQAEDIDDGSEIALKLLAEQYSGVSARLGLFKHEFTVSRSLVHPSILRPLDFFSDGDRHFFTMPLLAGGRIGETGTAPWNDTARKLLPICDALAYAHRKGVVHGDLKPHNILLDGSGAPCLTDFGAARLPDAAVDDRIRRGGGTPAYMSPQQLDGRAPEISDDVYALGCVFYELLCGFPPYAPDISEKGSQGGSPAPPASPDGMPELPEALVELVGAMLSHEKAGRPVTMQPVRASLEEILQDSGEPGEESKSAAIIARTRARPDDGEQAPVVQGRPGIPIWVAYALGGLLLAVAVFLFLALPRFAEERALDRPPPRRVVEETQEPQEDRQLLRVQRDAADEAMGDMLQDRNYLAGLQPGLWSGGAWEQAIAAEQEADGFYRRREYTDAQKAYGRAGSILGELRANAPDIGRKSLEDALQAIESGDQAAALAALEVAAILLGEADPEVQSAGRRAGKLPEIMQAVAEARATKRNGSLEEQRAAWQDVLKMDPERQSARQELAAVNTGIDQGLFDRRMSRGHAAMGEGDLAGARTAFEAARKQRPNASDPAEALEALELEERGERLAELQAAAMAGKFREDWRTATTNYRGMLDIDANIVSAQRGLAEAERRVRLDDALENTIANANQLNREQAWQRGKGLLDEAGAIESPGPRLSNQISRLNQALTIAATPAPVRLRSDGFTEVSIYHVGRLGSFDERVLQLRPGAYTAIGTREGFRDVRREFIVAPEGLPAPLVLICTEPI